MRRHQFSVGETTKSRPARVTEPDRRRPPCLWYMGTRTVLYERRGTIIPLITLMKGASGTPDPRACPNIRISECPNVRMSECPNIPSVCASSPTRRPTQARHPSTPHAPTRFATPVDAVDAADADGRRQNAKSRRCATRTFSDDATTRIRTRDDEDALERARTLTGRRVGAARDEANARWGSRRRC